MKGKIALLSSLLLLNWVLSENIDTPEDQINELTEKLNKFEQQISSNQVSEDAVSDEIAELKMKIDELKKESKDYDNDEVEGNAEPSSGEGASGASGPATGVSGAGGTGGTDGQSVQNAQVGSGGQIEAGGAGGAGGQGVAGAQGAQGGSSGGGVESRVDQPASPSRKANGTGIKYLDTIYDEILTNSENKNLINDNENHSKYREFKKKYDNFAITPKESEIIKDLLIKMFVTNSNNKLNELLAVFKKALHDNKFAEELNNLISGIYAFSKRHNYLVTEKEEYKEKYEKLYENISKMFQTSSFQTPPIQTPPSSPPPAPASPPEASAPAASVPAASVPAASS
ncbi:MSP7-like protein [Plasmodium berghei]|uniref:MSP7-like protein n=2 Tax=Plasmodium berghei TaxID=5821 RepID=A0A509AXW4_PLABA|nr:MSP7-like protein [Plasmodium berghei ANKA]SCL98153.1 MSP7-like protein [Plasmodium berghei]SCM16763.1 MSP7-like protein [Plasmodium berghei]SCN27994.1 MSP7-like protein [Plasmodium berghei]VUC57877.1 MSP7-like protein [Plasmodium berghei ANKA]|eukprot:XP_034423647.1 MSP7-like protein [Plasmodium berghei ANKA]